MSLKTKVLVVISNLEFGGAQRQIVELVNNIDRQYFDVHVCSLSAYIPLASQFIDGTPVHVIEKQCKFDLFVVAKLINLLRKYRFDVIHSFLFDAEIASRLAGNLCFLPIKIIGSERNTNYKLKKIQKMAYRLTKSWVHILVANSKSGAAYNLKMTGVAKDKYRVVYNGVDTQRFQPRDKTLARKKLNLPLDRKIIGMFASFKAQKNHPFIIDVLATLKASGMHFKLLLVGEMLHAGMHGSDHYAALLKVKIKQAGLEDQVIFLGNQAHVEQIYPACDFTVLPSLFEGMPNVLLESMACAVPVIASRVSDNQYIINDNVSGVTLELNNMCDWENAIKQFLEDDALRETLSIGARETMLSSFSSRRLAQNMQKIYNPQYEV